VLDDRGFLGPYQYQLWVLWLVLGLLLLALVAAWVVFVLRFSAGRLPPSARRAAAAAVVDLPSVRLRYLGLIDEVEAASRAGRLGERAVHSRLSLLLRFFVHETAGADTHVMTLADLREADLPHVADAVEQWYPPAFAQQHPGDPERAVETARQVVRSWS
jgi:hypothetical protein